MTEAGRAKLTVMVGQSPANLIGPRARLDWLDVFLQDNRDKKADLVVLPELFLTGYNIGERISEWAESVDGEPCRRISDMARAYGLAIHFGFAERDGTDLYNAAACFGSGGDLIGFHRKLLLPPGFEGDHFAAGKDCTLFRIGAFKIATLICYDAEFPENFRQAATSGADLVLVPTALGTQWGVVSEKLIPTRAFENGVYVCYANHCDQEDGLTYFGGSCIVGPVGQDLARAGSGEECLMARIDLASVRAAQSRLPYLEDREKLPWC